MDTTLEAEDNTSEDCVDNSESSLLNNYEINTQHQSEPAGVTDMDGVPNKTT